MLRVIHVIRVIVRILLLPWIQLVMIQVIESMKDVFFLVFRSVGSLVSLIQVSKQIDALCPSYES